MNTEIIIATRTTHYEYPREDGNPHTFDGAPVRVEVVFESLADAQDYRDKWEANYPMPARDETVDPIITRVWEFTKYAPIPF